MNFLHDAGITAIHIIGTGSSMYDDVSVGKYRFGKCLCNMYDQLFMTGCTSFYVS